MNMVAQLLIATALVLATILLHLCGLAALLLLIGRNMRARTERAVRHEVAGVVAAAIGLFALHGAEIWAYALFYTLSGALGDFQTALYFSTSTYTTIGYGDVLLATRFRLVGAIEGANGIILLGWSTAFFVAMVGRIGFIEREFGRFS